jgi:rRNA maturation RNase YbeY
MSQLHLQFMNLAGPTDVLTFPLDVDRHGRAISGEVVVCVPEARRRALREGTDVRRELLLYALHGMLHLCGFDDRTESGYATMHRTEDKILTEIGVGPVFANPGKGSTRAAARPRSSGSPTAGPAAVNRAPAPRTATGHRKCPPSGAA